MSDGEHSEKLAVMEARLTRAERDTDSLGQTIRNESQETRAEFRRVRDDLRKELHDMEAKMAARIDRARTTLLAILPVLVALVALVVGLIFRATQ